MVEVHGNETEDSSGPEEDRLERLSKRGVSIWLDDLSRELMAGGRLETLLRDYHVVGVTTNPTIFASALAKGERYAEQLSQMGEAGMSVEDALFRITTGDVRDACGILAPVYEADDGVDGRVSIEVQPRYARDTEETVAEALALWKAVDRPNAMVKIPATVEGLSAITRVIAEGISVNVTLMFSIERYREVMNAYMDGLERAGKGVDLSSIHSVASFFVSRVDTAVDAKLDVIGTNQAVALKGRAAVANAVLAYEAYEEIIAGARWQQLAAAGANVQRPLWASTGVKVPYLDDTFYVESLVAPGTVNTMPRNTLEAFADHGDATAESIPERYGQSREVFRDIKELGIDIDAVTNDLETEGLGKFDDSWADFAAAVKDAMTGNDEPNK